MSIDWRRRLERFRDTLITLTEIMPTAYEHSIVQLNSAVDCTVGEFVPRVNVLGSRLIERVFAKLPDGRLHIHYIVSCDADESGHVAFRKQAADMRATLERIPTSVVPKISVPLVGNGLTEGMLHWLYILHWLGGQEPHNGYFKSEVQFSKDCETYSVQTEFLDWDNFPTLPEFDALPLLTLQADSVRDWDSWQDAHVDTGRALPDVIAMTLDKPILRASIDAVRILLDRAQERSGTRTSKQPRKRRKGQLTDRAIRLISALKDHHGFGKAERTDKDADQDALAKAIGMSRSTVSRALGDLHRQLPSHDKELDPDTWYKTICDLGMIHGVLRQIEYPKSRGEFLKGEMDYVETDE